MSKNVDLTSREWCDLVFVGKNKSFGAYTMRVNSPKRYNWATFGVIIVVAFAFALPKIVESFQFGEAEEEIDTVVEMTQLPEAEVEKQEEVQPLVETPPPPPLKSSIKFTPPVIKKDEEVADEDEMKSQEELTQSKVNISIADVQGNDEENGQDIADFREVIAEPEPVVEEEPYQAVEQMPTFPGGDVELMRYLSENIKYPSIAQEQGIQGRVILRFVVSKTGAIDKVQVLRSLDPSCDKEAVRVVKSMPKWIPGKQNGSAVPVYYTLPVQFKLM